jgi:hypothetical protein
MLTNADVYWRGQAAGIRINDDLQAAMCECVSAPDNHASFHRLYAQVP